MKKSMYTRLRHFHRQEQGATLVELLLTIALLALISTVFMQMLNKAIDLRLQGAVYTEANKLANAYAEQIKTYTTKPSGGSETKVAFLGSAYDVKATWTDKSGIVSSTSQVQQSTLASAAAPNSSLTVSDTSLFAKPITGSDTTNDISALTANTLYLNCVQNPSTLANQYTLSWTNGSAPVNLNLGEKAGDSIFRVTVNEPLTKLIHVKVSNTTGNTITFQVVDDPNSRINIVNDAVSGSLKTITGLVSQSETNTMTLTHYTVQIEVFKGTKKITELLTSVTMEP